MADTTVNAIDPGANSWTADMAATAAADEGTSVAANDNGIIKGLKRPEGCVIIVRTAAAAGITLQAGDHPGAPHAKRGALAEQAFAAGDVRAIYPDPKRHLKKDGTFVIEVDDSTAIITAIDGAIR